MAKFPVELDDDEGRRDAINYLLSGPAGLGQNFSGFSAYAWPNRKVDSVPSPVPYGYLTGNYRKPYSQPAPANLYVPPISLGTCTMIDGRTWKFFFATPQPTAPFALGSTVKIQGVADDWYDGTYDTIGVVECTTDYVAVRTSGSYDIHPDSSGGTATQNLLGMYLSTDCNARCTVSGGTDKVFISGQLDNEISYQVITPGTGLLQYDVLINRYSGTPNSDITNPDYSFNLEETVAIKQYQIEGLTGTGIIPLKETVFTSIFDQPKPGYYWYIMEVQFYNSDNEIQATQAKMSLRSLSVQVVKQ